VESSFIVALEIAEEFIVSSDLHFTKFITYGKNKKLRWVIHILLTGYHVREELLCQTMLDLWLNFQLLVHHENDPCFDLASWLLFHGHLLQFPHPSVQTFEHGCIF